MEAIVKQIYEEYDKANPDWGKLQYLFKQMGAHINDIHDEETLLSQAIESCWEHTSVKRMLRMIRLLLSCGYDPNANNGYNGAVGLYQLCWSSYNNGIIAAAKVLLDAGADPKIDPHLDEGEDAKRGILNAIGWKLAGAWHQPPFDTANLFEAYYDLAGTAMAGEDYHNIFCYDECLNKTLSSVNIVNKLKASDEQYSETPDYLVLWFENQIPMVFNRNIDCVVNPVKINHKEYLSTDESAEFGDILKAKLTEVRFIDSLTTVLVFSNGHGLLVTNNYGLEYQKDKRRILYRILDNCSDCFPQEGTVIDSIMLRKGDAGSDATDLENSSYVLRCESGDYLIYEDGVIDNYILHSLKLPTACCSWLTIKAILTNVYSTGVLLRDDHKVCSMTAICDQGHLYLNVGYYWAVVLQIAEEMTTVPDILSHKFKGKKIRFRGL